MTSGAYRRPPLSAQGAIHLLQGETRASPSTQPPLAVRGCLLRTMPVGQVAQEWDGSRFGIMIEPTSTSLVLRSEELDNGYWTPVRY